MAGDTWRTSRRSRTRGRTSGWTDDLELRMARVPLDWRTVACRTCGSGRTSARRSGTATRAGGDLRRRPRKPRVKVEDDIVELAPLHAIRIAPGQRAVRGRPRRRRRDRDRRAQHGPRRRGDAAGLVDGPMRRLIVLTAVAAALVLPSSPAPAHRRAALLPRVRRRHVADRPRASPPAHPHARRVRVHTTAVTATRGCRTSSALQATAQRRPDPGRGRHETAPIRPTSLARARGRAPPRARCAPARVRAGRRGSISPLDRGRIFVKSAEAARAPRLHRPEGRHLGPAGRGRSRDRLSDARARLAAG